MAGAAEDVLSGKWWLDKEALVRLAEQHESIAEVARVTGVPSSTLRDAWARHGLPPRPKVPLPQQAASKPPAEKAGLTLDRANGTGVLILPPTSEDLGDVDALLSSRGLDPDKWLVERLTVNEWDSVAWTRYDGEGNREPIVKPLRQLKAYLRFRPPVELLFPAVEVADRWQPPKPNSAKPKTTLAWIAGDQQAPYHDAKLHEAVCRWLADVKPDMGVLTGDTADFPTISRHMDNPHWNATPQECVNAAFRVLSDYRDAAPEMALRKLRGNHDWRLESELLTRAERMFGLKPAEIAGFDEPAGYSIRRLLHLDKLGIELIGREGDHWKLSELELSEGSGVFVRHSPPSAQKLTRLHRSIVAGDTHRQSLKQVTFWHDDTPHVATLIEAGCLCEIGGFGYIEHPDWQQGFCTVVLGGDGSVGFDLATWRDGKLTWRGETWEA